jgi:hypothetical protein
MTTDNLIRSESGFSILEYIVALILITVAFVTVLELTATGVKNGSFVQRLGDVQSLATSKASELQAKHPSLQNKQMNLQKKSQMERKLSAQYL